MTTRWKITVEYDGSAFHGWQSQPDRLTVQGVLESAVHSFSGETVSLYVAGRTDAGVHALAQVAHFDLEKKMEARAIAGAINFFVRPHRISVLAVEEVSCDFHARFDAKARSYRYLLDCRHAPLALMAKKVWHCPRPLELKPMQEGASHLLGYHDFSTFRASGCQANSPLRTLDRLDIRQEGTVFIFETKARSFLYHQVRNMVGTLSMVGTGQWSVDDLVSAFKAADRSRGGPTAPADGLYFCSVDYDEPA